MKTVMAPSGGGCTNFVRCRYNVELQERPREVVTIQNGTTLIVLNVTVNFDET